MVLALPQLFDGVRTVDRAVENEDDDASIGSRVAAFATQRSKAAAHWEFGGHAQGATRIIETGSRLARCGSVVVKSEKRCATFTSVLRPSQVLQKKRTLTTCAQVALLVQRVKWTRDVEFAIDASLKRNDLSAWDDLAATYKQDAKEKAEILRSPHVADDVSRASRSKNEVLLLVALQHRESASRP